MASPPPITHIEAAQCGGALRGAGGGGGCCVHEEGLTHHGHVFGPYILSTLISDCVLCIFFRIFWRRQKGAY